MSDAKRLRVNILHQKLRLAPLACTDAPLSLPLVSHLPRLSNRAYVLETLKGPPLVSTEYWTI